MAKGVKDAHGFEEDRRFIHKTIHKIIRQAKANDSALCEDDKKAFIHKMEVLDSKIMHKIYEVDRKRVKEELTKIKRNVYDNSPESYELAERGIEAIIVRINRL
jgi:hypothetical protein